MFVEVPSIVYGNLFFLSDVSCCPDNGLVAMEDQHRVRITVVVEEWYGGINTCMLKDKQ